MSTINKIVINGKEYEIGTPGSLTAADIEAILAKLVASIGVWGGVWPMPEKSPGSNNYVPSVNGKGTITFRTITFGTPAANNLAGYDGNKCLVSNDPVLAKHVVNKQTLERELAKINDARSITFTAPALNTGKQLTEGSGYYQVQVVEPKTGEIISFGANYWTEGKTMRLPSVVEIDGGADDDNKNDVLIYCYRATIVADGTIKIEYGYRYEDGAITKWTDYNCDIYTAKMTN